MSSSPSLAGRTVLAVGLMIGFYILAMAMAGTLLYIPYAVWTYAGKLHANLVFFCALGAGTILWAILPRPDRFVPPGPPLHPMDHPKLFEVLAGIAKATQQEMPSEVYLTAEVNAWVIRSRRHHGIREPTCDGPRPPPTPSVERLAASCCARA